MANAAMSGIRQCRHHVALRWFLTLSSASKCMGLGMIGTCSNTQNSHDYIVK